MTERKQTARIAGGLYLGVVATGLYSLMYVPNQLIDYKDAATTFQRITQQEYLYRTGIVAGLFCYGFFLFLPLALYKLFKDVHTNMAQLMVLLAIISVPMYFINAQNQFSVLSLIGPSAGEMDATSATKAAQVLGYLDQYRVGMRLIHIFSGLWLFPFGWLVYRSGFLPKFFGVLLMLGCFGYLTNFLLGVLMPGYAGLGVSTYISLPASIGEIGICLWLLLAGARKSVMPANA